MTAPAQRWRWGLVFFTCVAFLVALIVWSAGGVRELLGLEEPLGDPADVPAGGTYDFLAHQPGEPDEPVAWDPCDPIHYEINPDDAHDDADEIEEFVADAIEVVAHYTGLTFVYDGRTDRRPVWDRPYVPSQARHEPVLIAWATEDEVPQLEDEVAGIGGALPSETGGGWLRYVTGGVTLDADAFADIGSLFGDGGERRAILLHELGHLVGLDHVNSPDELMFSDNLGRKDYGTGDLNGLVRLGKGRCA